MFQNFFIRLHLHGDRGRSRHLGNCCEFGADILNKNLLHISLEMCQCMKAPNWWRHVCVGRVCAGTTGIGIVTIGMLAHATKEPSINEIFISNEKNKKNS